MPLSPEKSDRLLPHRLICIAMLLLLAMYNVFCHVWADEFRFNLAEPDRVVIRSIFYLAAIVLFPLANLMRHVFLRLNQTMPGEKCAERRYLVTVIVTQSMIEAVSLFGMIMFLLGDDFNTLYIFSLLGLLGIYLHRPRLEELEGIDRALAERMEDSR